MSDDLWNAIVCFQLPNLPIGRSGYRLCISVCVSCTVVGSGKEARISQIDFSAAFAKVDHQGILFMLCSVGIGGAVFL